MNLSHQVKMSLRLWRLILPLAYIGHMASGGAWSRDSPIDTDSWWDHEKHHHPRGTHKVGLGAVPSDLGIVEEGAVFLTHEFGEPGILFAFEAYFRNASPVSLQVWKPGSHGSYSVDAVYQIKPPSWPGPSQILIEDLPGAKCVLVKERDRLGIQIRDVPSSLTYVNGSGPSEPPTQVFRYSRVVHEGTTLHFQWNKFQHQFSVAAFIMKTRDYGGSDREVHDHGPTPCPPAEGLPYTTTLTPPPPATDTGDVTTVLRVTHLGTHETLGPDAPHDLVSGRLHGDSTAKPSTSEVQYVPSSLTSVAIVSIPVIALSLLALTIVAIVCSRRYRKLKQNMQPPPAVKTPQVAVITLHSEYQDLNRSRPDGAYAALTPDSGSGEQKRDPCPSGSGTGASETKDDGKKGKPRVRGLNSLGDDGNIPRKVNSYVTQPPAGAPGHEKPDDEKSERSYTEINPEGDQYAYIHPDTTNSAKGSLALRKDGPVLKLGVRSPLDVNPDGDSNETQRTYLQLVPDVIPAAPPKERTYLDILPDMVPTGGQPNPVESSGRATRVAESLTGDDDDGERYLKPINQRSDAENPGRDVIVNKTEDVFEQLDPGQYMLPSRATDSNQRYTRLPSDPQSDITDEDHDYVDAEGFEYSPIPQRESPGTDHPYLEILPNDDDVTGQRSERDAGQSNAGEAKYLVLLPDGESDVNSGALAGAVTSSQNGGEEGKTSPSDHQTPSPNKREVPEAERNAPEDPEGYLLPVRQRINKFSAILTRETPTTDSNRLNPTSTNQRAAAEALPSDEGVDADPYMDIDPLQTDSVRARRSRKLTVKSIVDAFSNDLTV